MATRTIILGFATLFSLTSATAIAIPQEDTDSPQIYCLCTRPNDGRQDPDATEAVCPSFAQYSGYATAIELVDPNGKHTGTYFGACANIGWSLGDAFKNACLQYYNLAQSDGVAGSQCCQLQEPGEPCKDYPP
ncbi:hypothetical protein HII31_05763 [Pseudocercospora fuligena]|uniref:Uncharacterized protein n=1 Tax=Pseudocercospora fuligena TaxID=685502 RepID=A0A8H6RLR8_9PEZI|nr:hypothetical protein HII31_05763 [Pseudocercospora fuligena]